MPKEDTLSPPTKAGAVIYAVMPCGDVVRLPKKQTGSGLKASRPSRSKGRTAGRNPNSKSSLRTGREFLRDADCTFSMHLVLMCPSRDYPTGKVLATAIKSILNCLRRSGVGAFVVLEFVPKCMVPHYHILTTAIDEAAIQRVRVLWLKLMRHKDKPGTRGAKVDATPIKDTEHEKCLRQGYFDLLHGQPLPMWYLSAPIRRWCQTGLKRAQPVKTIQMSTAHEQAWHAKTGRKPFYKRHFHAAPSLEAHIANTQIKQQAIQSINSVNESETHQYEPL